MPNLTLYIATHNRQVPHLKPYMTPVHAGKINSSLELGIEGDDSGDNISALNPFFSELTVLYWVWKNKLDSQYIGIAHYRRLFAINPADCQIIFADYDFIVPHSKLFKLSLEEQYKREHGNYEWDLMIRILRSRNPEYFETAKSVFCSNRIYRFNMLISDPKRISAYCEWVFPLLFEIWDKSKGGKDSYQSRYPGFLSERLFTLYVYHNQFKLKETKLDYPDGNYKESLLMIQNRINDYIFKCKSRKK
ncbi:DUF4422 domain-containing protein [Paenibacillus sp. DMB5]|uniref:DUF4422 domain-containing protein n=1 Tax=Paenibacillus sp. DMB5 TaxID=1780103 RepID=UPI00076C3B17|nr:DUF4422 domain-containing protein [Paenibacillus sp. DMB5]KUP23927.1 hypothetical protein AWJ19_12335 [Paenibacillus sp. DMB5]